MSRLKGLPGLSYFLSSFGCRQFVPLVEELGLEELLLILPAPFWSFSSLI